MAKNQYWYGVRHAGMALGGIMRLSTLACVRVSVLALAVVSGAWAQGGGTYPSSGGGGGGTPGGSSGQFQFNQSGAFGGSSAFVADYANGLMALTAGTGIALTVNGDDSSSDVIYAVSTSGGIAIRATATDTDDFNGLTAAFSLGNEIDSTGSGDNFEAFGAAGQLSGTNVAGDSIRGARFTASNGGTGTAGTLEGVSASFSNSATATNAYAYHATVPTINTVTGIIAAFAADNYGASAFGFYNGGVSPNKIGSTTFSVLGTPVNASSVYCSDCTVASGIDDTCAGSGSGAFAERVNGVWKCRV